MLLAMIKWRFDAWELATKSAEEGAALVTDETNVSYGKANGVYDHGYIIWIDWVHNYSVWRKQLAFSVYWRGISTFFSVSSTLTPGCPGTTLVHNASSKASASERVVQFGL